MARQPQGKIILYNYDAIQSESNERICIALSPKTIALCLASIEYARWAKRWQSLIGTTIVQDEIEAITDNALSELMNESQECMCCDETNTILSQVNAGLNAVQQNVLATQYDGTPQSIGENLPENFDGDATTDYAAQDIDYALCKAVNEAMATAVQDAARAYGIAGAAAIAMTGILFTFNPLVGIVVGLFFGVTLDAINDALEDGQAMRNVVCCILKGLRGVSISQSAMTNAYTNSGCEPDGNEATYLTIWDTFFAQQSNYVAFLAHYANALTANDGASQDSACECCSTGQDDLRLDYGWKHGIDYNTQISEMSMYRDGNILHISCYHYNQDTIPNDNEFGFRLYSPSGCCQRMRILNTSPTLTYGSGSFYSPIIQREGSRLECCGDSTNLDNNNWFSSTDVKFRFAEDGYTNPSWLYDIQIEIDPEYAGC